MRKSQPNALWLKTLFADLPFAMRTLEINRCPTNQPTKLSVDKKYSHESDRTGGSEKQKQAQSHNLCMNASVMLNSGSLDQTKYKVNIFL